MALNRWPLIIFRCFDQELFRFPRLIDRRNNAVIGGADLVDGLVPRLDEHSIHSISIMGFPSDTTPGILDELNKLPLDDAVLAAV